MRDFRPGILPVLVLLATPGMAWGLGLEAGPPMEPPVRHADAYGFPTSGDRPCLAEYAVGEFSELRVVSPEFRERGALARPEVLVDPRFLPAGWAAGALAASFVGRSPAEGDPLAASLVCGGLPESAVEAPPVDKPGAPMTALALLGLGTALALLGVKGKGRTDKPAPVSERVYERSVIGSSPSEVPVAPVRPLARVPSPLLARRLALSTAPRK